MPFVQSPADEYDPRVSPDRRLLAYASADGPGAAPTVWLRDFPTPVGKWNVSPLSGRAPRWSPDGRYLYYWRIADPLDSLFRVRVDRTPSVVVQAPEFVVALKVAGGSSWDLHPDGKRFVYMAPTRSAAAAARYLRYYVLQGWFGELRRLIASAGK